MNIVNLQIDAYNRKNIGRFLDCYDDSIIVRMLDSNMVLSKDKKNLKTTMEKAFIENPNSKTKIIQQIRQGNLVINHELIRGHIPDKIVKTISIYLIENNKIIAVWFGGRTLHDDKE